MFILHRVFIKQALYLWLSIYSGLMFANESPDTLTPGKPWNFMVYMCNNNNLYRYGIKNFKQMTHVGSCKDFNVLLQMDEFDENAIKRYYIEKNNPILEQNPRDTDTSFSGTPENLFEFAEWAIKDHPAQNSCIILWNHGSGIKDPGIWGRMIMCWRDSFFKWDSQRRLFNLDRNVKKSVNSYIQQIFKRGIAFNDYAEQYIDNEELKSTLVRISQELLAGKKIDIVAMDACLMAMVEVASQIKNAANIMVASEEIEQGSGYNYENIFASLPSEKSDAVTLSKHIVACFDNAYTDITGDYTHSAIDLSKVENFEKTLKKLTDALLGLLKRKNKTKAGLVIQKIRNSYALTTEFLDADYIDLGHLLKSLVNFGEIYGMQGKSAQWIAIHTHAIEALVLLKELVIATVSGVNLNNASGLSIYFPKTDIHQSYYKTDFAKATGWHKFLKAFIAIEKKRVAKTWQRGEYSL